VRDRFDVIQADREAGYAYYDEDAGREVYQYEEGTILVDVADALSDVVVWRGWAQTDITGVSDDPDRMGELIDDAIVRMFASFPIPSMNDGAR